jgi:nucleoside-diphosphate-sugar epimerase
MKVILFGATGMVGQGALRECLLDPGVEKVLAIVRRATGQRHEKLREIVHRDFLDFSGIEGELAGYDVCLFALGVSSAGMSEPDYVRVTYDVTMAAASAILRRNPALTFVFVSGASTDGTEKGRVMWARVKGRTENALLRLPFKASYMFRPAYPSRVGHTLPHELLFAARPAGRARLQRGRRAQDVGHAPSRVLPRTGPPGRGRRFPR